MFLRESRLECEYEAILKAFSAVESKKKTEFELSGINRCTEGGGLMVFLLIDVLLNLI